jgi:L-erythro-3,5-diaminohexanoate dehydrogenase
MKGTASVDIREQLGADRVLAPSGSLPQPAARLDASGPVRPHEIELAVEILCLDSTSHRNIREHAGGNPVRMSERIAEIVAARGKMHNPETDSGGVLLGTVAAVGADYPSPPALGERIVSLGSMTQTPLRLEAITDLKPDSPQVGVSGTAYVCGRAAWAPVPPDLSSASAIELYDVCAAASQIRELAPAAGTVCVLGAGHAGKLALAAARDAVEGGTVVAVDVDPAAVARASEFGLCDVGVSADLRDPLAAFEAVRAAGAPPADLTVVVVNAGGCESTALLLTADGGTVLFFSMATSFAAAALAADGVATDLRLVIGSGYTPDRGSYALELVRGSEPLRRALGLSGGDPA